MIEKLDLEEVRSVWKRKAFVKQHTPKDLKRWLTGIYEFSQIKFGDVKKGQGDVVIVNLKDIIPNLKDKEWGWTITEFLSHTLLIDRVETEGIFTNIYFSRSFFKENMNLILAKK